MESKKRNTIITTVIVLLIVMVAGFSAVQAINTTPPGVATVSPERLSLTRSIVINGVVAAGDSFETALGFTQKVAAVNRKPSDLVQAGDVLVELDTTELQYQIEKIEVNIDQLRASTAIAREQARLNLANAQLALAQSRNIYTDALSKFEDDEITELARDQASTTFRTAENQARLAQAVYDSLDITSASSDRGKQIEAASLDIENLRRKIADSTVRSPITGTVTVLDARPGQLPTQQTAIIQVVDLENLKIEARVDQYEAVQLAAGQPVKVSVKGLKGEFDATVQDIDDVATRQGGASATPKYTVTIAIDPAVLAAARTARLPGAPASWSAMEPAAPDAAATLAGMVQLASATNPTDPTDPTDPTESTYPVEPTDPLESTDPLDPLDPTEPTDPADPAGPADGKDPALSPAMLAAALKPGFEVDARVILEVRRDALVVPLSVVRTGDGASHVLVVRADRVVRLVVVTGLETDGMVEIVDGIEPDDRIISSAPRDLKDGEEVRVS